MPTDEEEENLVNWEKERKRETWSKYLEDKFGKVVALSFSIGSEILLDYIKQDLEELSKQPKGTHIGQLDISYLQSRLPQQFFMHYDYDFLYTMKTTLVQIRKRANWGHQIIAHSVLEEILLVLVEEESEFLIESYDNLELDDDYWKEWAYDVLGDADLDMFLYSDEYLTTDDSYHISHWLEKQFYCDEE